MANFLEFLKSGKSAREFIDDAILPSHVRPVTKVETSPAPYTADESDNSSGSDIPTPQPDDLTGADADDKAQDIMDAPVLSESAEDENPDDEFMRQLEAFEKTTFGD